MSQSSEPRPDGLRQGSAEPSALAALLARVEAATGPDRELDAGLAKTFGWTIYDDGFGVMDRWRDPDDKIGAGVPPPFTASLDAALSLCERVLPGWETNVLYNPWHYEGRGCAYAAVEPEYGQGFRVALKGSTRPLALIAAMLKALIAEAASPSSQGVSQDVK